ncbi:MAG: membrane protein insertion efficiency factor YidD [Nitrospirota bacterium]
MKQALIGLITLYQWTLSPLLPRACRFAPTCSCYAVESVRRHGVIRGLRLTAARLLKCQPFHPGGYDPVR